MPQNFVRIVNRGTYTNARKAQRYVERELAVPVEHDGAGTLVAIHMLEAAELAILRGLQAREKRAENQNDGIARRWVKRMSGGRQERRIPVMQLRRVVEVGADQSVEHWRDPLTRRQGRACQAYDPRDHGR